MNIAILNEGVTVRPAVLNGKMVDYPLGSVTKEEVHCQYCNGTGKDDYNPSGEEPCEFCNGSGKYNETKYNFPHADVSYQNCEIIADLLGVEPSSHMWIKPENVPAILRRLIYIKNTSAGSEHVRSQSSERETRVDHSGDIPTISSGPEIIDFGVDEAKVKQYIDKLIEILSWAKRNECGVSWA